MCLEKILQFFFGKEPEKPKETKEERELRRYLRNREDVEIHELKDHIKSVNLKSKYTKKIYKTISVYSCPKCNNENQYFRYIAYDIPKTCPECNLKFLFTSGYKGFVSTEFVEIWEDKE